MLKSNTSKAESWMLFSSCWLIFFMFNFQQLDKCKIALFLKKVNMPMVGWCWEVAQAGASTLCSSLGVNCLSSSLLPNSGPVDWLGLLDSNWPHECRHIHKLAYWHRGNKKHENYFPLLFQCKEMNYWFRNWTKMVITDLSSWPSYI